MSSATQILFQVIIMCLQILVAVVTLDASTRNNTVLQKNDEIAKLNKQIADLNLETAKLNNEIAKKKGEIL